MSKRVRFLLILGTLVLLSLSLVACNRERPAPAGTAPARGTVAAPTAGPAVTQIAAPTAIGGAVATPVAPSPQQVVASPAATSATTSGGATTYTVVAGDTLNSIAARFGTTPEAIAQLNSLADPNALTLGQTLRIPGGSAASGGTTETGSTTASTSEGAGTYTVQQGDTLSQIAQRFDTTVQELVRLNNLANPDSISVGQELVVPSGGGSTGAAEAPAGGQDKSYVIQRGDTLMSIARRFGLTVKQLQDANNITNPDRIYPGQTLVIP